MPSKKASGGSQSDKSVRGSRGSRGGRRGRVGGRGRGSVGDRSGRGAESKGSSAVATLDAKKAAADADWFKAAWRKDGHQEKSRLVSCRKRLVVLIDFMHE